MFTLRLSEHWELRAAFPDFIFANNTLAYHVTFPPPGEDSVATKQIQSLLLGFPLHVKFLSDRIGNFRVYMLGGFNYQYDLASNSSARKAQNLAHANQTGCPARAVVARAARTSRRTGPVCLVAVDRAPFR